MKMTRAAQAETTKEAISCSHLLRLCTTPSCSLDDSSHRKRIINSCGLLIVLDLKMGGKGDGKRMNRLEYLSVLMGTIRF